MCFWKYFGACLVTVVSVAIAARPVSYPGGTTIMQQNDVDRHSLHVHYSPTARYSIGYRGEYWRDAKWQFHGGQVNYLLRRWNRPASQANIYLKSAAGIALSDEGAFDNEREAALIAGIAMDWEDRRFFTSYENRAYRAGDIDSFFMQKARIGIAPYIGDYGDLHTWLMVQIDHVPENDNPVSVTPLLRFFKGVQLAEFGVSDEGEVLFNWIIRL